MSRRAWWLVAGGYLVMAAGFLVFAFVLAHHVNENQTTVKEVRALQQEAATIAVHNAGATCTVARKLTNAEERELIDSYLELNVPISHFFPPECVQVARRAARDIFGTQPLPPALERELHP